ncbi:MAG: hypothetical protein ACR2OJ_16110 [Hyphomicrobiales bacterium]
MSHPPIGIDLGTTNSLIGAFVDGKAQLATGQDRLYVRSLISEFETVIETQDPAKITRSRGEITEALNRIDDFYVS